MKDASAQLKPQAIHLRDYRPVPWTAQDVALHFDLHDDHALVTSTVAYVPNPAHQGGHEPLVLNGIDLVTERVQIDGDDVDYQVKDVVGGQELSLNPPARAFSLQIVTRIRPQDNTTMEGLYRSGGMFCTQMEAEGFRRVVWHLDRPDVLSTWTVDMIADQSKYPVLLCNGNLVETWQQTPDADGQIRHGARWHDPHPKPAYLFALVAGDLDVTDDTFVTASGREVKLRVFVDKGNCDQSHHAMESLKLSMKWDEQAYGREYDLDVFHIVAVHDFNMGAMENKGLNLFNASAVLAKAETATDGRFARIEAIVAHEYFHNWTGNRITCRDWFQLSLKEGLTVFRDQEFSADMNHRGVQRINDVRRLRAGQFNEDAGPMSHPVRPSSYIEISNFYTSTIYEKGAEVIRMMHTLLGPDAYRDGTDLYFERYDGQAVTCDDFLKAMRDGGKHPLQRFERWYSQAGTPHVDAKWALEDDGTTLVLTLSQQSAPTPGQPDKEPLHIPVRVALIGANGGRLPLTLEGQDVGDEAVLSLMDSSGTWRFTDIQSGCVPSILRAFSAPVKLTTMHTDADLVHLAHFDDDAFNRWEAIQTLALRKLLAAVDLQQAGQPLARDETLVALVRSQLMDESLGPALVAEAIRLPSERTIAAEMKVVDVDAIHAARRHFRGLIGRELSSLWRATYGKAVQATAGRPYAYNADDAGWRSLKNTALAYLAAAGEVELLVAQHNEADNMTDELAAFALLVECEGPERQVAIDRFVERWQHDSLVMNNWFAVQASSSRDGVAEQIGQLTAHPNYDQGNPNKVRSLYGAFAGNPRHFHAADGSGYALFAAEICRIDSANPILAGRLARLFGDWRRHDASRQSKCEAAMRSILEQDALSKNTYEAISTILG